MELVIAVLVSACLLAAAFYGLSLAAGARARKAASCAPEGTPGGRGARSCPLCSSRLEAGERVKSSLFPGKADRIMHIFGCAHCWPASVSTPRLCPVCGRELDAEGWVIARYFERPGRDGATARGHIHVLGCTNCRG